MEKQKGIPRNGSKPPLQTAGVLTLASGPVLGKTASSELLNQERHCGWGTEWNSFPFLEIHQGK